MRRHRSHVIRPLEHPLVRFRLAALAAAQFFDLGTFDLMVRRHGLAAEANPIIAQGMADWGIPLVVVSKLALCLFVGSLVVLLAERRPARRTNLRLAAIVTVAAVLAGLIGGVSNVAAL